MATIVNTPASGQESSGMGPGMIIGVVLGVVVLILLLLFGIPALRRGGAPADNAPASGGSVNLPGEIDVNINPGSGSGQGQ